MSSAFCFAFMHLLTATSFLEALIRSLLPLFLPQDEPGHFPQVLLIHTRLQPPKIRGASIPSTFPESSRRGSSLCITHISFSPITMLGKELPEDLA